MADKLIIKINDCEVQAYLSTVPLDIITITDDVLDGEETVPITDISGETKEYAVEVSTAEVDHAMVSRVLFSLKDAGWLP